MLKSVSVQEFAQACKDANRVLIDVRTPEEFNAGHITKAENINSMELNFANKLQTLDKTVPYAVYCHSGNRSSQALRIMEMLSFTDVVELTGGIATWVGQGHELVT